MVRVRGYRYSVQIMPVPGRTSWSERFGHHTQTVRAAWNRPLTRGCERARPGLGTTTTARTQLHARHPGLTALAKAVILDSLATTFRCPRSVPCSRRPRHARRTRAPRLRWRRMKRPQCPQSFWQLSREAPPRPLHSRRGAGSGGPAQLAPSKAVARYGRIRGGVQVAAASRRGLKRYAAAT